MQKILILLLGVLFAGCAFLPTLPSVPPRTMTPVSATVASSIPPARGATSTPSLGDALPPPATVPPLTRPGVLARFSLLDLPGAGRGPSALAQLDRTLYVANRNTDNIAVIRDRRVTTFIATPAQPDNLLVEPARGRLWVSTYVTPTLNLIQSDAIVAQIAMSEPVGALALYGDQLVVGLANSPTIELRDSTTLEKRSSVRLTKGFGILRLIVDLPRRRLIVGSYGHLAFLDLGSLSEIGSMDAPLFTHAAAVNPVDGTLWAGIYDEPNKRGALAVYDVKGKEVKRLLLDDDLSDAAFEANGQLYVLSSFTNRLTVVDGSSANLVARVNLGMQPTRLWVDESSHLLYAGNSGSDNISVIDTRSYKGTGVIPLAPRIEALASSEERGRVYVANASTDSVFVIVNTRVAGEIPVGHHPTDLALDPLTGRLFVANAADGTVSVIDETSLLAQSTLTLGRGVSSVAVDSASRKLLVNSMLLGADSMKTETVFQARGQTAGSNVSLQFVRVDAARQKIYGLASNGIPGSNNRTVLYATSENNPNDSRALPYRNGGNVTALDIDAEANRVYAAVTHPLAFNNVLAVWDGAGNAIAELPLGSRTLGLLINHRTNHLFLSHTNTYVPSPGPLVPRDNTVQILDTRSLGEVGSLQVPGGPAAMALVGNTIYVAGREDGSITLIGDAATAQAEAPTATMTPTRAPTFTPRPPAIPPVATFTPLPTLVAPTWTPRPIILPTLTSVPPSPVPTATPVPDCGASLAELFHGKWNGLRGRFGCPVGGVSTGNFAYQPFLGGFMIDDLRNMSDKRVYAFFADGSWQMYPDSYVDGQAEDSCPAIPAGPGLVKPIRGFGRVWCTYDVLRARLPGGTSGEAGLSFSVQLFERGMLWAGTTRTNDPLAVFYDGGWQ